LDIVHVISCGKASCSISISTNQHFSVGDNEVVGCADILGLLVGEYDIDGCEEGFVMENVDAGMVDGENVGNGEVASIEGS